MIYYNSILIILSMICLIFYIITGNIIFNILTWVFLVNSQILTVFKAFEIFKDNELLNGVIIDTYKNMPEILNSMKDTLKIIAEELENIKCNSTTSKQP